MVKGERVTSWALICSEQCYVLRQTGGGGGGGVDGGGRGETSNQVVQRVPYKYLKNIQPVSPTASGHIAIREWEGCEEECEFEMSNSLDFRSHL